LHAPSIDYLLALFVATVAALGTAFAVRGGPRWWAAASSIALLVLAILAGLAQRQLVRIDGQWEEWRRDASARSLAALHRAIDAAAASAKRAAGAALNASSNRAEAFTDLDRLVDDRFEQGIIVYRSGVPFAWAGTTRISPDLTHEGPSVIASSFYLSLQFAAKRDNVTAVVTTLLGAISPGDRLARPIANGIANTTGVGAFAFEPPTDSSTSSAVLRYETDGRRLFDVRANPLLQGEVSQRITERARAQAGIAFVFALIGFVIGVWRATRNLTQRVGALAVGLATTALVPLNQYSNLTRLFDPAYYFTAKGGPLTGNAGALAATSAIVLLGILAVFRRRATSMNRWQALATVLLVVGVGPFLLRELARGVQVPAHGVDAALWLIWEIPLFLAAVTVLLTGAAAGASLLGPRRGVPPWCGPAVAAVAAVIAPPFWQAPGRWPWWYTILWVVAIGLLALSRRTRLVIVSASAIAALGATTLVWGRTAKGRVDAAERDLVGLNQVDNDAVMLLQRFGMSVETSSPVSRVDLLQRYVASDIAAAGNPISIAAWPTDSLPSAVFETADIPQPRPVIASMVAQARRSRQRIVDAVAVDSAVVLVMAAPSIDGGVTSVVLAPKSRLFEPEPFASLLGLDVDPEVEPPYTLRLREGPVAPGTAPSRVVWRRDHSQLHGDGIVQAGATPKSAHVEVELRPTYALIQRGALLVILDLALVALLWFASVIADGGAGRWLRARRRTWGRSYRVRLSIGLFLFFIVPASAFAVWSYGNLAADAARSRELLVNETLRAISVPLPPTVSLASESDRLGTPLFLYVGGELAQTSDPLYEALAPTGRFLRPPVELSVDVDEEETAAESERIDRSTSLFGYRAFSGLAPQSVVIAAPARADELPLGRRRRDLSILVLFATAVGAFAALWLSGIAARQLARPIGTLREAALSIAAGTREPPLEGEPMAEFHPVFTAFRRMAADLNASRTALEEAQRRTAAVLRNVASGVVAVDPDLRVALANPRAEALLGGSLAPGTAFATVAPPEIVDTVAQFIASRHGDEAAFELSFENQQLRGTLTRLSRGGAVVTVDDVTELARAQRVLAWGEMARQVAHEIKNPLTPIRLGVQHLRRARHDKRVDFDRVLEQNVNQILAEIDRLDEIARSFSRYGAAPEDRPVAGPVDVASIVREVVSLERMGEQSDLAWRERGVDVPVFAMARADELKEVLLNVLENARLAQARSVTAGIAIEDGRVNIAVSDDGHGIAPDVLPRIFEPHFSTRTSGSGLGLAISRRLVEGWGGEINVDSTVGVGTTVTVALLRAAPA
jgi:signal transduction histidine kinase